MTKETKTTAMAAGLVTIISLGFLFMVNSEMDKRSEQQSQQASLTADIEKLEKKVATKEQLDQELDNLKTNFGQYVKILPSPEIATQERLMELVQDKAERSQFEIAGFVVKPEPKTAKKGAKSAFREVEIQLNAKGTFEQFLRFLNSLERHESFIRVNSFNCTAAQEAATDAEGKAVWPITVTLNISTFRFDPSSGGK